VLKLIEKKSLNLCNLSGKRFQRYRDYPYLILSIFALEDYRFLFTAGLLA